MNSSTSGIAKLADEKKSYTPLKRLGELQYLALEGPVGLVNL